MLTNMSTFLSYTREEKKEFLITFYQEMLPKCETDEDRQLFQDKINEISDYEENEANLAEFKDLYQRIIDKEQEVDAQQAQEIEVKQTEHQGEIQEIQQKWQDEKQEAMRELERQL